MIIDEAVINIKTTELEIPLANSSTHISQQHNDVHGKYFRRFFH
jgi:hypothetical protein